MTLLQFFAILSARWKVMLAVLVAAVAGTAIVNVLLPRSYTSTAAVLVDVKSPDPIAGIFFQGLTAPSYMATQVDVIQSDRVSEQVVRTLRLDQSPSMREQWREATRGEGSFEIWMAGLLRRSLDVKPSRESNVITISYKSVDPKFASSLANAYARAYIDVTLELRVEPARQYGRFFDERAKQLREKVEQARARISTFQRENGIVGADERLDIENARLNELSSQFTALQAVRSETSSRQAQAVTAPDRLQDVITNPVIGNIKTEMSRQEARLVELSTRFGDNHPSVVDQRAVVGELRSRLEQETRRVSGSVSVSNTINGARLAQVQAALDAQRIKVLRLKETRNQLAVLANDLDSSQRAYDAVTTRSNQTELESRTTQTNVSVLNPASEPSQPSSPRTTLNMLLALFVGTLSAIGAALLLELFDRRVRSAGEVAHMLDIPLLGVIAAKSRGRLLGRGKKASPLLLGRAAAQTGAIGTMPARQPRDEPRHDGAGSELRSNDADPADDRRRSGEPPFAAIVPLAIGDIFRDSDKLSSEQVGRVLAYQREHALLFGEAAVALKMVEDADVLWALSQQFRYSYAGSGAKRLGAELVVANSPFSSVAESFRGIRSQLIRRLGADKRRRIIAVVSADQGDGKTFVAANLAVAFSQLGRRTVLVDADMRQPRLAQLFDIERGSGLSSILSGRVGIGAIAAVGELPSLFVLPCGTVPPNPLELLESPAFGALLDELAAQFDHVIVDTPSASLGADAGVISARGGAYLSVARRGRTRMDAMAELVQSLRDPSIGSLGFIVNEH